MKVRNVVILAAVALAVQACGNKDEAVVPADAVVTHDEAAAEAAAAAMPQEEVDGTALAEGATAGSAESKSGQKAQSSNTTVTGTLQGIEVGDNVYVSIKLPDSTDASYLCGAQQCGDWVDAGGLPANLAGKTVTIELGTGQQVDGSGNVMGEMEEALSITVAP
jgi:hypothetical protein